MARLCGPAQAAVLAICGGRSAPSLTGAAASVGFSFAGSSDLANQVNVYPMASLKGSARPDLACAFVDLVTGGEGQQLLAQAGFAKP
jgi:ABC-type molybdate transport system substrate-binding protein